jgi:hypothetical protein
MKRRMTPTSLVVLVIGAPMMMGLIEVGSCGLTRDSFTQIAANGVDDRINSYPWGMDLFDADGDGEPEIYIGTVANALCAQVWMETYLYTMFPDFTPPERWQCRNDLWDPNNQTAFRQATGAPAHVFRGRHNPDDTWTWDRVWDPCYPSEVTGFRGAKTFNGALYMLGNNNTVGAHVWKTTDGVHFEKASPPGCGYGLLVNGLRGSAVFNGKLYVASDGIGTIFMSSNPSTDPNSWKPANSNGFVLEGGGTHEQVYYSGTVTTGNANYVTDANLPANVPTNLLSGWAKIRITEGVAAGQERTIVYNTGKSFYVKISTAGTPFNPVPAVGDKYQVYNPSAANNSASWQLAVANGYLYASTYNGYTGAELWKSNDPRPGNWTRVIYGGYGNTISQGYMSLCGWNGYIWLGTVVYPPNVDDLADFQGCEILRVDANDNVEVLVGMDRPPGTPGTNNGKPLSGMGPGFDYMPNVYSWYTSGHDGWFYVGTYDMAGMFLDILDDQFPEGLPPEYEDMMDLVFGPDRIRRGGFDLWRTKDGINWAPVILDGLGDRDNYGLRQVQSSPWGLLIGVANAVDGFEVWLGK